MMRSSCISLKVHAIFRALFSCHFGLWNRNARKSDPSIPNLHYEQFLPEIRSFLARKLAIPFKPPMLIPSVRRHWKNHGLIKRKPFRLAIGTGVVWLSQ